MIPIKHIINSLFVLLAIGIVSCTDNDLEETVIVPKTLEQYKAELSQFVSNEKKTVENCVVGYNKGDFKSTTNYDSYKSAYLTALLAAEVALTKSDLTIADIVNTNKTLATPGKAFTGSLWISDRRPLNDSIISSEALNTATLVGVEIGQVTDASKTAFTAAITAAKAVRGSSTSIERQIQTATKNLEEAEIVFKASIIK